MEELEEKTVEDTRKKGKHAKEKDYSKQNKKTDLVEKEEKSEFKENIKREENTKKENKGLEKILTTIIIILAILTFIIDIYYIYTKLIPKFKDITIEIGYEKELSINDFVTKTKYLEDSKVLTDISQIDLSKVRRI